MPETYLKVTEINAATKEVIERNFTESELEEYELAINSREQFDSNLKSRQEARTSALAKLAALGLTEDEIAAL